MSRLLGSLVASIFLAGCQTDKSAVPYAFMKPVLHKDIVPDEEPLPAKPDMKQIARSLPLLDFPWEDFAQNENVTSDGRSYELLGDGAQSSFRIRRMCDEPLLIEIDYGPFFDGFGLRMPIEHYTFERVPGGWKRKSFSVTYHGSVREDGTYEPPLSEKDNRRRIEKITGKPYDYHFRGR